VRSFTISEAADATGLTQKALRARIEQGHIRAVLREGTPPRIPESELRRAGLLPEPHAPELPNGSAREAESEIVRELVAVIERQAAELAALRSQRSR
jgi:excisionase family DNA binding protein